MNSYGMASAYEFLQNNMVYRNLIPMDNRIPSMKEVNRYLGNTNDTIPRKISIDYASIVAFQLQYARSLDFPNKQIQNIIFIGDTFLNDGTAYANICNVSNFDGLAIIISEKNESANIEQKYINDNAIFIANRWNILIPESQFYTKLGLHIVEETAVILDLDKTIIGARGRNDRLIDKARLNAAHIIANELLGSDYDRFQFQNTYDTLDKTEYHQFTTDNVDYLVYICLVVGSGFIDIQSLTQKIKTGIFISFEQFVHDVDTNANKLTNPMRDCHRQFYECFQLGDPTPFKKYRRLEYKKTIDLMGQCDDNSSANYLVDNEIVLTQEVRQFAKYCRDCGALLFGLSDKPDEASIPSDDLAAQGYKPIHQTETHAVGE